MSGIKQENPIFVSSVIIKFMETSIKSYEKFIQEAAKKPTRELADHHKAMVQNFQHERLAHLIIMLFFAGLTLGAMCASAICLYFSWLLTASLPVYLLTVILMIMTFCYVKHYYFLENHTQNLYKYTRQIYDGLAK